MRFNTFFLDSEHERYQHGWFPDSEQKPTEKNSVVKLPPTKANLGRSKRDAILKAEQLAQQQREQKQKKSKSVSLWDYLELQSTKLTLFQSFSYHPNLQKVSKYFQISHWKFAKFLRLNFVNCKLFLLLKNLAYVDFSESLFQSIPWNSYSHKKLSQLWYMFRELGIHTKLFSGSISAFVFLLYSFHEKAERFFPWKIWSPEDVF